MTLKAVALITPVSSFGLISIACLHTWSLFSMIESLWQMQKKHVRGLLCLLSISSSHGKYVSWSLVGSHCGAIWYSKNCHLYATPVQLDCFLNRRTRQIIFQTKRKDYGKSKTKYEKLSARRIQIFWIHLCVIHF